MAKVPFDEIKLTLITREDGGLRICSDSVLGLILSGPDPVKVLSDVWPAILALKAYGDEVIVVMGKEKD